MRVLEGTVQQAAERLRGVAARTPLQPAPRLSDQVGATVYLKREDLQEVRSFKIRGAYNKIASLDDSARARGVVCASAGNHAQGVAYAGSRLATRATIFMPEITPLQKIERVKHFGGGSVDVRLSGDSYDAAGEAAKSFAEEHGSVLVHPFDDELTVAGQGTVALEILADLPEVDAVIAPIGGGGLASGVITGLRAGGSQASVVGAEPLGAASMAAAVAAGHPVVLEVIDNFVDGAAVKRVGDLTYEVCAGGLAGIVKVPEGRLCTTLVELYQQEGIIAEPAGALAVSALEAAVTEHSLQGKLIVCIVSGGNNDILRYAEILERSLVYQGLKHYFIVEFAQKPGQLRQFVDKALGPTDDIVRFEYMKKTNKERGAALVGIELRHKEDLEPLIARMLAIPLNLRKLTSDDPLYDYVV